jgi:hypothetical protein
MFYGNLKAWRRNHEASSKELHKSRRESVPNFRKMETSLLQHTTKKNNALWKFESLNKKSWTILERVTQITQRIGAKFHKNGNFSLTAHYQTKFMFYGNLKAWIRNHEPSSKQTPVRRKSAPNFRKMKTSLLEHITRKKFMFYGNLKAWVRNHEPSSKQEHQSRRESAQNWKKKLEISLLQHVTRGNQPV